EITVDLLGVRSREFALRDALHQSDSIRSGRRFVELYCELDWRQRPQLGTGMSNRLSTLDAVFSTVSNSTEIIPKRAAASTSSARSSRYKMSCGAALSSSRQFRRI